MIRDIVHGAGLLFRGIALVAARPKLVGLGMLPPLITSVLMIAALVGLGFSLDSIINRLTGFMNGWGAVGDALQVILAIVVVGAVALLMVLTFTAITLAVGDPIYQQISRRVDAELGPLPPEPDEKVTAATFRTVRQLAATIGMSALGAIVCFLLGLVPAVGAALAAIAAALIGGRLMVREITGPAFERRGLLEARDRRPALGEHRALAMGFGVPAFWLLSIPGVAVLAFPAAVAGATMLVRRMMDEPEHPVNAGESG